MTKRIRNRVSLICAVCLIFALCAGFTAGSAAEDITYTNVPMFADGIFIGYGCKIDTTTYVPIRDFCEALGQSVKVSWSGETGTVVASMDGLEIEAAVGNQYIIANGRYLYAPGGVHNINGTVYVPVREIAKAFGVTVTWDPEIWTVGIKTEGMAFIESGDGFYDEDDLYWLSRIINSESGNQPLDGKIGVGNVVLNRVEDEGCPDTVYGVIFDYRYGVQFHVTVNGAIYAEPNEESVIAAKLCLEGYEIVGDSLYFVNPVIGASSWFSSTRTFIASIGEHDFYA